MNKNYTYIFYESRCKKAFNILLYCIIEYLFVIYELYQEWSLLVVAIFLLYVLILEIIEFIRHEPVIKISDTHIWIKNFGSIDRSNISEIKLDFNFGYRIPWLYLSLNFYQTSPNKIIYQLPINTVQNIRKLKKVLHAEVE